MIDTVRSYSAMLRRALEGRVAADARTFVQFPFAPAGMAKRIVGRDALAAHLERVGGRIRFDRITEPVIHRTGDPEVLILEFEAYGRGVGSGEPYEQGYVSVIRTRGRRIVHIKEYWNPLAALRALRGKTAVDALTADMWPASEP